VPARPGDRACVRVHWTDTSTGTQANEPNSALMNKLVYFVFFLATFQALSGFAAADQIRVTTIAGTGKAGQQDGAALSAATFLFPSGVASDRNGNLYIVDTASQRVRVLSLGGSVRTLAGSGAANVLGLWVPGGYRDGAALQAQFNGPSGIAISGDSIFVADTGTSVIRRITRDGIVSTYAGTPFKAGDTDGPRSAALFSHPIGLASDGSGNLFIADSGSGIRKIDNHGIVTTVKLPIAIDQPVGISVYEDSRGETLFVADALGIVGVQPTGEALRATPQNLLQGGNTIGYASAITAVDNHAVIYTDARTHTVRYLDFNSGYGRVIGGQATETAAESSGSFRDGAGSQSWFDAPTGVLYRNNDVIVADSGNRRIRRITGFDRRSAILASEQLLPACNPANHQLQIALVGNSYIYWDADWESSIPGQIEATLGASQRQHRWSVRVTALQTVDADLSQAADYLSLIAKTHCYGAVVFLVNLVSLKGVPEMTAQIGSDVAAAAILRQINEIYAQARIPILFVALPTALELGPSEGTWVKMPQTAMTPQNTSSQWRLTMQAAGAPYVDMWPVFISDLKSAAHQALYGTVDVHLTPHGRALVASSVSAALKRLLPMTENR